MERETIRSTTILGLRHKGKVVIGGDGQVSIGQTVMKQQSNKIRTLAGGSVLTGFAGSAADAFNLLERFEAGIVLVGTEVKSARLGKVNLKEAYPKLVEGEV